MEDDTKTPMTMSAPGSSLCVLVVEDEALIAMAAVDTLVELGHTALTAANGRAALDILRADRAVDMMLLDMNLPDMNGQQIAEAARQLRPRLPIIFATGYRMEVPADLAGTGPTAILGKPYWAEDLRKAIGKVR